MEVEVEQAMEAPATTEASFAVTQARLCAQVVAAVRAGSTGQQREGGGGGDQSW